MILLLYLLIGVIVFWTGIRAGFFKDVSSDTLFNTDDQNAKYELTNGIIFGGLLWPLTVAVVCVIVVYLSIKWVWKKINNALDIRAIKILNVIKGKKK